MMRVKGNGVWLCFGVFAVAIIVQGCGGQESGERTAEEVAEQAIEKAGGGEVDVDVADGRVTMTGEDHRTEAVETSEWPEDLPGDVPRFSHGKVERVMRGEAVKENQRSYHIWVMETDADAAEKYAAELEQAGWQTQGVAMGPQGGMVTAEKGDLVVTFMHSKEQRRGKIGVMTK